MKRYKPIRVTSVLDWVDSHWKAFWWRKVGFEAADKIGRDSAAFGTRVHDMIEGLLKGTAIILEESPETLCSRAVINYLTENKITPLLGNYEDSMEIEVKDKDLGLIGHFDYAALVDGVPTIVDFKTSNKMRKSFPLQKAFYAHMANKQFKLKIDNGLTIRSHWNKETQQVDFEVKHYDKLIKKYWPIARSCLLVWKYFNRVSK